MSELSDNDVFRCHPSLSIKSIAWLCFVLIARSASIEQENVLCPSLRSGPTLYSSSDIFSTDFTEQNQVQSFLSENYGRVNTDGVLACRRSDHLLYNTSMSGAGLETDVRGLRIVMDNNGGAVCDHNSEIATGHLLTRFYLQEGRIDLTARMGYGPDAAPRYHSEDSFSCLGLYVHQSVSQHGYRNEISMCVSSKDPSTVRMGVWNGSPADQEEARQAKTSMDLSQAFHTYSIEWTASRVRFWLDDLKLWDMPGQRFCAGVHAAKIDAGMSQGRRLPYEPMSVRIILRPLGIRYKATTYMDATKFSYSPLVQAEEESEPVFHVSAGTSLTTEGLGKARGLGNLWQLLSMCVIIVYFV